MSRQAWAWLYRERPKSGTCIDDRPDIEVFVYIDFDPPSPTNALLNRRFAIEQGHHQLAGSRGGLLTGRSPHRRAESPHLAWSRL